MLFDKDTLVAENDSWSLWTNDSTHRYQKELDSYAHDGFTLEGKYRVMFAKSKTSKDETYLAMDCATGRPVIDWKDMYDFDFKKFILMDRLRDECDIVRMAEKRREDNED